VKSTIFGSPYIAERVAKQLANNHASDLVTFLKDSSQSGHLGPLCGHLFEAVAHLFLKKSMKFLVKRLGDQSLPLDVQFQRACEQLFDDISEIDPDRNCYAHPIQKNYPSIDSLRTPNTLFSITVAENHDFKDSGVRKIHPHLNQPFYILYVVVPDYLFSRWAQHSELNYSQLQLPGYHQFNIKEQWALEIPLTKLALLSHDAPDLPVDIVPPAKKSKPSSKEHHCRCRKGDCSRCQCSNNSEKCDQDCSCSTNCQNRERISL
jgi:hypothetical protein